MMCSPRSNVLILVGTLLVANINDVLGTQASGFRDEAAQQDSKQTAFNKTGIVLESITEQSGNTYDSGPNSKNVYGWITQQTNQVHSSSPDSTSSNPLYNPLRALTVRSGNTYNPAPSSKNFYGSIAQQNNQIYSVGHHGPSNTKSRTDIASGSPEQQSPHSRYYQLLEYHRKLSPLFNTHGSVTIQTGNTYKSDPGSKNVYGSITHATGQVYTGQGTPCVNSGSVTIQRGNTYNSAANSENVYGSITNQTNQVYSIDQHGSSNGTGQRSLCINTGSVTIQEGNTYS